MSTQSVKPEDTNIQLVSCVPESSRRYIQWKEEDIRLLLKDLEQPGHYSKWKENKSGYSKRVGEQIFKNNMNHEAIKFKVRWLESRFNRWHAQLACHDVENDQNIIHELRERILKDFPYYDSCEPIFTESPPPAAAAVQQDSAAPAKHHAHESNKDELAVRKPESCRMINSNSPPNGFETPYPLRTTVVHDEPEYSRRFVAENAPESSCKKRRHTLARPVAVYHHPPCLPSQNSTRHPLNDHVAEGNRLKSMELELELKKMNHQERMQEMKLEQLRLEIELETLKRGDVKPSASINTCD